MCPDGSLTDDALLARLASVLSPDPAPPLEPSADELAVLAAVVANHHPTGQVAGADTSWTDPPGDVVPIGMARHRPHRYAPPVIGLISAATILAGATAAAAATGAVEFPRPVRQVVYELGVPGVESPNLTDLRQTLKALSRAAKNHDPGAERAAVIKLTQQYRRLDRGEQKEVRPAIQQQDPAFADPSLPAPTDTTTPLPAPTETTTPLPAPTETTTPLPAPTETTTPLPAPTETTTPLPAPTDVPTTAVPAP